jgi:hypothetical protein
MRIDQDCAARADTFLERGTLALDPGQNGKRGTYRQLMPDERPGKERHSDLRERRVAVLPIAPVKRVEVHRLAADRANRHASADDLAVSRHVGLDAPERLAAARMDAKAGDQFVKNQRRLRLLGDAPDLLEKFDRLQIGLAALHGLDEDGGEFMRVLFQNLQRVRRPVFENQNFVDDVLGNSRRDGYRLRFSVDHGAAHQDFVIDSVVSARHGRNFYPPRHRAGQSDGRQHGFRTGVAKGHPLHAGQLAHQFRNFSDQRRLRPHLDALAELPLLRANGKIR